MLQPREQHRIPFFLVLLRLTLCITFICIKTGLAQHSDDVYIVEPTPALRLNSQDLTTILLLNNNNNRASYGRHSNPKPTVGLLTSTARTFIQEGVTTEYATQVLGTTLDNGRLYAQLLKKSSRVLYDKSQPSIAPTAKFPGAVQSLQTFSAKNPKSILQSHNDIIGDKDWQLIDDHLLLINNDMHQKADASSGTNDVTRSNGSLLVFPARSIDNGDNFSNTDQISAQRFGNYSFSSRSSSQSSSSSNARGNISAQKVLHPGNLPTYTIKNIFAPSGFSWDSPIEDTYLVEDKGEEVAKFRANQQQRTPKLLKHDNNILANKLRNMVTTTYFGFADFTTIVGDTVIVFSPSTSAEHGNHGQVTSIKGEATLNDSPQETAFITHVPITVTQDLIEPTFTMQQVVETVQPTQSDLFNEQQDHLSEALNEGNEEGHDQSDLTMPEDPNDYSSDDDNSVEEYMTTTESEIPDETTPQIDIDEMPDNKEPETDLIVPIVLSSSIELEPSVVVAPEEDGTLKNSYATETTNKIMLSKPSNEDISKIFASLASVEAAKKLAASQASAETTQIMAMITTNKPEEVTSPAPTVVSTSGKPLEEETTEQIEDSQQPNEPVETTTNENISSSDVHDKEVENLDSYPPTFPNKIEVDEEESIIPETTSAETKVAGGVTTIFFEDDPFVGFEPTATLEMSTVTTIEENSIPAQTASTEEPISETTISSEVPDDTPEALKENNDINKSEISEDNVNENKNKHGDECQEKTSEVIPTLLPKTLTYLTTFFISDAEETSTSVESNVVVTFDVSYSTKRFCMEIISSSVEDHQMTSTDSNVKPTFDDSTDHSNIDHAELSSSLPMIDDEELITTTPNMIITEKAHVTTEQTPSTEIIKEGPSPNQNDEESSDELSSEQSDEEIELIYKTLYTTYTYLTTFFHESTTSVSSRKEIITNVITSTVSPNQLQNSVDVTDILASISPSIVQDEVETTSTETTAEKAAVAQSDLVKIDNILREDEEQISPTTSLDEVNGNAVKTYYTTYTYFTTIFVDGETEIMSRTEVYTNLVSDSVDSIEPSLREKDSIELTVRDDDNKIVNDIIPTNTYFPPAHTNTVRLVQQALSELSQDQDKYRNTVDPFQSSIVSSSISSSAEDSEIVMVTDIKSSSSDGDRHIIENINKHWNGLLEDQISSESNTDEILPSSTLLLQTSYTTFTYFTTMYIGSTSSNILSRLETITNVVTETLQPTQMLKAEDSTLPITYFTTFTYWTTLYKDGETTTISREETVSNIVTPTAVLEQQDSTEVVQLSSAPEPLPDSNAGTSMTEAAIITKTNSSVSYDTSANVSGEVEPSTAMKHQQPTTFYTTYTYFTTQYVGDETVISSRFETVTNVNTPIFEEAASSSATIEPTSSLTLESTEINLPVAEVIATTTEAQLDESIIEINQGKIVDAEGISTLLYTTKTVATHINGEPTTLVMKTSSLNVDEAKKALIASTQTDTSTRTYKTGLVRLIDGTIVANLTTTLYQSKVIGTIIDGRYAQIIESTSSFLIEKTLAPSTPQVEIIPTAVKDAINDVILQTSFTPTTSMNPVEGSINDGTEEKEQDQSEDDSEDVDDSEFNVDESGRPKSRLTFQTKKKTFTPVIRPFASRNRPQFAPKRKNGAGGSATIITRSDFTPTITATPALKSESSRGRFSSSRKGGSSILNSGAISGSSRKFARPGSISSSRGFASSSAYQGSSRRGFSSSRIQPTASSYFPGASRRGGASSQRPIAGSSNFGRPGASSLFPGNSRLRIKPTSISPSGADIQANTNIYTTQEPETNEDTATQLNSEQEQDDVEVTTEALRRPNSLVKLRRPPIVGKNLGVSQRRNPLAQRPKATTTTTTTTPKPQPRAFQRPSLPAFGNRPRTSSGLFPPRGLFKPQTLNDDLSSNKKDDEGNDFGDDLDPDEYDDEDDDELDEDLDRNRRNNVKRHIRAKRQAPSFRNRFRRPSSASKNEEKVEPAQEEPVTQRSRTTARYSGSRNTNKKSNQGKNNNNKNHNNNGNGRIRPTKASSTSRAQFTLREKDTATKPSRSSSFRRPTTSSGSSGSRRTATTAGRPKAPRLKTYANSVTEAPYSSRSTAGRSRQTTSRGRSTTRSRGTTEFKNNDPVLPVFDGTITVTHHIPTEITIPVVNGKVTEYKNIVTAQIRTEVLAPNQYNTLVDRAGSSLLVLAREESTVNGNGATEVTQFILHETPTTSVIFTPTTIRGRKTSFSHIIPSTVYDVENVVSTIQPQIAAQAPLANILLSQLLLGNIGLPQQQINPALIGLGQTGAPGTPTTEFKTRTTSYVTTVTNEMSTVIPLTFRGKEILTTIFDSSVNVITATEYITDTIVVTPAAAAVQQVNSLLLPLLLQQQAQGAQPLLPIQNSIAPQPIGNDPLLNTVAAPQQNLFQDNNFRGDLDLNRIQQVNLDDFHDPQEAEEFPEQETFREAATETSRSRKRHHRKGNKHNTQATSEPDVPQPALETSVVTLYVSGRRPGEFSTILSTVVGQESSLRKRNAEFIPVEKSATVDYGDIFNADETEIKEYLLPAFNDVSFIASSHLPTETQSLESIVGDVSRWFKTQSDSSLIDQALKTIASDQMVAAQVKTSEQNESKIEHFLV